MRQLAKRISRQRRWALPTPIVFVAVFVAAVLVAACGGSATTTGTTKAGTTNPSAPVTLTFWNWNPAAPTLVSMFNETHPGIKVIDVPKPGGEDGEYPDLLTAIKSGTTPDLAQVEYDVLPQFVASGGLLNLANYGVTKDEGQYSPFSWAQVTFNAGVYAIPQGDAPDGYYYNATLFKRYGLTVPTTWSQLASEAESFHKAHPSMYLTYFPSAAKWFALFAWQQNSPWFRVVNGAWKVNIDSPAMIRAANLWQSLIDSGAVTLQPGVDRASPAWYENLSNGTILSLVCAQWCGASMADYAPSTTGDWRVTPLQQWALGQQTSAQFGGSTTAIFKTTKYPQAALTFATWLVSNERAVNYGATHGIGWPVQPRYASVPSLVQPSSFYANQTGQANIWAAAEAGTPTSWNYGPDFLTVDTEFSDLWPAIAARTMTLSQVLAKVQSEQITTLRALGVNVVG